MDLFQDRRYRSGCREKQWPSGPSPSGRARRRAFRYSPWAANRLSFFLQSYGASVSIRCHSGSWYSRWRALTRITTEQFLSRAWLISRKSGTRVSSQTLLVCGLGSGHGNELIMVREGIENEAETWAIIAFSTQKPGSGFGTNKPG